MGVLTENPPSGGLLADLLARLMASRQMPPQPALGGRVMPVAPKGPGAYGDPVNAISATAQADLQKYVDQEPPVQTPPMGPPPAAQQGPMGGMMSAPRIPPNFPMPMQKPPQPMPTPVAQPAQQAPGLAGHQFIIASPGMPGSGHAKKRPVAVAKAGLSDSDLLNLQQLFPNMNRQQIAALWARRQAAG